MLFDHHRQPFVVEPHQRTDRIDADRADKGVDQILAELFAAQLPDAPQGIGRLHAHRMRTIGSHRVVGIDDRRELSMQRQDLAGNAMRITAAIEALMVLRHHLQCQRRNAFRFVENNQALIDMALDATPFVRIQGAGLIQNRIVDARLAHILQ